MLDTLVAVAAQELVNMNRHLPTTDNSNLNQVDRSEPNSLNVELSVGQDTVQELDDGDRAAAEQGTEDKTTSKVRVRIYSAAAAQTNHEAVTDQTQDRGVRWF